MSDVSNKEDINLRNSNATQYNEVYVEDSDYDEGTEIEVETVYLTIPSLWVGTYRKLLMLVADAGKSILDDCSYACKGDGSIVFNCWNIFQSACAAYTSGDFERATLFINYVDKQISAFNTSHKITHNDTAFQYTITPDGAIKVDGNIVNGVATFTSSKTTYEKYQEWLKNYNNGKVYVEAE